MHRLFHVEGSAVRGVFSLGDVVQFLVGDQVTSLLDDADHVINSRDIDVLSEGSESSDEFFP